MILRVFAVITAMCVASAAHAENAWSIVATGCVPDSATIKSDRYSGILTSVRHATGNIDLITLLCPIPRFNSSTTHWNLKLKYQDTTGTDPAAYVAAKLFREGIGVAAGPQTLATANSNASAITGVNVVSSPVFIHTFNFENFIYWVRIELDRTVSTGQVVTAYQVILDGI
jgi:hypothetical protein